MVLDMSCRTDDLQRFAQTKSDLGPVLLVMTMISVGRR